MAGQWRDITDYMLQGVNKLQGERGLELHDGHVLMSLVDILIGGTETTASTLSWVILFLLHHPEVRHATEQRLLSLAKLVLA